MTGAVAMILAGLFPPIGNFFASLPQSVLGGCTIMMFGTILTSGMQMIANCGFTQRNITIVAMALSIGIGFTTTSESGIWAEFSPVVQSVFSAKRSSSCVCSSNYHEPDPSKEYGSGKN